MCSFLHRQRLLAVGFCVILTVFAGYTTDRALSAQAGDQVIIDTFPAGFESITNGWTGTAQTITAPGNGVLTAYRFRLASRATDGQVRFSVYQWSTSATESSPQGGPIGPAVYTTLLDWPAAGGIIDIAGIGVALTPGVLYGMVIDLLGYGGQSVYFTDNQYPGGNGMWTFNVNGAWENIPTLDHKFRAVFGGLVDADSDGVADAADNCPAVANANQANGDGDAFGDACDACPSDPSNDADGDGLCANLDNCPAVANANQSDWDDDGVGDVCDPDDDNDEVADGVDNCPLDANANQADFNADGEGDVCDDSDVTENPAPECNVPGQEPNSLECPPVPKRDFVPDAVDNCPTRYNPYQEGPEGPYQPDADGDGIGDACQTPPQPATFDENNTSEDFESLDHEGRPVTVTFDEITAGTTINCTFQASTRGVGQESARLAKLNAPPRAPTQQLSPVPYTDQLNDTVVYSLRCTDQNGHPVTGDGEDFRGVITLRFPFHGDPDLLDQNVVDVAQAQSSLVDTPIDQYDRTLKPAFPDQYGFTQASCDCVVEVGTDGFSDFLIVYDPVELAPDGEPAVMFSGFLSPYKLNGFVKKGTLPIKFQLTDRTTGMLVQDPNAFITLRRRGDAGTAADEIVEIVGRGGDTGNRFRYDSATGIHQFNWDMNSVPPGNYVFTLTSDLVGSHSGFVAKK